jgi:hypothetical protein
MGLIGRLFNGVARAVTAPIRAFAAPFTFAFNMLKTGVSTLGKLAQGDIGGALSTLVGGTIKNTLNAGFALAQGGMPLLAFADGAARQNGLSLT